MQLTSSLGMISHSEDAKAQLVTHNWMSPVIAEGYWLGGGNGEGKPCSFQSQKQATGCPGKLFLYQVQGMMTEFALDVGDLQDIN